MSGSPASRRIVANAAAIEFCETRSNSTITHSPPCSRMAAASRDALASLRVVSTVKNPSRANFCAMAPPTPQRTPTGSSLSSTGLPCASKVLRPSDCHLDVAPITTQTCLPFVLVFIGNFLPRLSACPVPAPPGAKRFSHDESLVLFAEPRQFLGEHRHALAPGARHLGDAGAPEHAMRAKRIVDLSQIN